jgi:transposase
MSIDARTEVLNHLGLVSTMYEELGIGELIDTLIPQDTNARHVSIGQAVKAMVLNGLGFAERLLYLTPDFFRPLPVERLIGPGVEASHLNDDTLGRALEALVDADVTGVFSQIAQRACQRLGLTPRVGHLDATSFKTTGVHNSADEEPEEGVVQITRGYSRDHRPDLNQVALNLMVEHRSSLPLLMAPISGNQPDVTTFAQTIEQHLGQLQSVYGLTHLVMDSAGYTIDNIRRLDQAGVRYVSRVSERLKAAKDFLDHWPEVQRIGPFFVDYSQVVEVNGIKERWLLVITDASLSRAGGRVQKRWTKRVSQEQRQLSELQQQRFACEADARRAAEALIATLTGWRVEIAAITGDEQDFSVQLSLTPNDDPRWHEIGREAGFILATNDLDTDTFSDWDLFEMYKDQSQVEGGFRFMKDPLFHANRLFLKSPRRIMGLLMVMTVCLLVYAALEYRLRSALAASAETVPNQKGKPTATPTIRWVFTLFNGIHVLYLAGASPQVLNLTSAQQTVLRVLGSAYEKIYG